MVSLTEPGTWFIIWVTQGLISVVIYLGFCPRCWQESAPEMMAIEALWRFLQKNLFERQRWPDMEQEFVTFRDQRASAQARLDHDGKY